MSLIPSESYSFPDHFSSTVTPSRKPKEEKTVKADAPRKKPTIVALPDPPLEPALTLVEGESQFFAEEQPMEPVQPVVESVQPKPAPPIEPFRPKPAPPNPALLRASAPPPRIPDTPVRKMPFPPSLKPKVRWNNRAPAMDPASGRPNSANEAPPVMVQASNVIPMQPKPAPARPPTRPAPPQVSAQNPAPAPPPQKPIQMRPAQPRPAAPKPAPAAPQKRPVQAKPVIQKPQTPAVSNPQTDFFEMFAENGHEAAMRRRQQMKFRRFIACEGAALAVLAPLVILGLTLDIGPALRWLMNIFTIAAAISAAMIPIVFYAVTPTLPELER